MPKITNRLIDKLTPAHAEGLANRTVKQKDLAKELKVTSTHLSRTLSEQGYKRTPSPEVQRRKAASALASARLDNRQTIAEKVLSKTLNITTAAKLANCSERTLHRYIAKIRVN